MEIELHYQPTKKQLAFHASTADEVLYGGAAGGGKSYAICWDALMRCLKYPQTHAYLFRRTYPELEMTLIRTMQLIAPKELGKYVSSAHELRLSNGSVIHFCVRCASNPGGPGHAWVKARFVDSTNAGGRTAEAAVESSILGGVSVRKIEYIPATAMDNPHITRDYIVELEQKPKALRDALLLGKWDAFDGQAFPEFVDDPTHYGDGLYTHVIRPFDIPWHWTRVVSFDHGYTRPFSFGVWAVDEEGRVYRYKELYGCVPGEANVGIMNAPGEIAEKLAELMEPEAAEGIHVSGVADPAIWDRSRGLSVEEQIRKVFNGVTFMKGDNTRLPGKMQLHERLKFDEEGRPMLYVFENCRDFRRTIPALVYDGRKPEDIDTAGEDHIYDETRYFLMSRPIAPRPRGKEKEWRFDPLGE